MPRLEEVPYDGFTDKAKRLGLEPLLEEIRKILRDFDLRVLEQKDANGGAALRELIDARFENAGGWTNIQTGGVDWTKCRLVNGTRICIGIEVQVSARSDMLVIDIHHLREAITEGAIDLAVLVVPSDQLGAFLTDRAPCLRDAKRHMEVAKATDLPFLLIGVSHDGPGPALAKRYKRIKKPK